MKLSLKMPRESGYALSNWLVALVITLTLAGIGFAAMTSIVAKSRLVTAQEQLQALENGLNAYKTDRNGFPLAFGGEHVRSIDAKITAILRGGKSDRNPNGRCYWSRDAISPRSVEEVPTDPFGGVYWIALDADADGKVRNPVDQENERWLEKSVLVFSPGPDGDPTTWGDNVRNWK